MKLNSNCSLNEIELNEMKPTSKLNSAKQSGS